MMNKFTYSKGITLIELMIVVVVVALLASIAMPAYQDHVTRAKRSGGKAALLDGANRMEKYMYSNATNNYANATLANTGIPATSTDGYYTISISALTATSYTLTATPAGSHADAKCGNLTYNQTGTKGATGSSGGAVCWR